MGMKHLAPIVFAMLLAWPFPSHAGRISTYIVGKVQKKTAHEWIVRNPAGTYWIKVTRPVSWTHKFKDQSVGFWVEIRNIKRYRANTAQANN